MSEVIGAARPRPTVGGKLLGALVLFAMVTALATRSGGLDVHGRETAKVGPRAKLAPVTTPAEARRALVDNPTDSALLRVGFFDHPLVPVGPTQLPENRELARALVAYDEGTAPDFLEPLVGFLETHPGSAWKPALLVGLGDLYRKTGHFSKALETWQSAWELSKNLVDKNGRAVGDAAVGALSQFEAYLGRKELLAPLLDEVKGRPLRGTAAELVSESMRGLAEMLAMPESSFRCGPLALQRILSIAKSAPSPDSLKALEDSHSTPKGLSLTSVQAASVRAGMNFQMAFRTPGARIVTPAVVHWKVGHYAAVLGTNADGRYQVEDSTFGEAVRMRPGTLEQEASGYFLIPPGPLPEGWRSVEPTEGDSVWGRGNTGSNKDNGATGPNEHWAFDCGKGGGCTDWNVEAMVVGLTLHDEPVGYKPPVGPDVRLKMYYSHRDVQQPQTINYGNFGPKWTSNWVSWVYDNIFYNGDAIVTRRGGGSEAYQFYPPGGCPTPVCWGGNLAFCFCGGYSVSGTIVSQPGWFSHGVLTRLVDSNNAPVGFQLLLPDGSIELFQQLLGLGSKWFLSQVVDPQGNSVKIHYDGQARIAYLEDAIGQHTTFSYNPSDTNDLKIYKVTDPYGRTATFDYDTQGRLIRITDVLGIKSTYTYFGTPPVGSSDQSMCTLSRPSETSSSALQPGPDPATTDFVCALTTPYGTTQFSYTNTTADPGTGDPSKRSVTITDSLGRTSYVEFRHGAPGISDSDPANMVPTARTTGIHDTITTSNQYLSERNTFVFDAAQLANAGPMGTDGATALQNKSTLDYTKAKLLHWLHFDNSSTFRVLESTKEPLESRIWYDYPGQLKSYYHGTSNQPLHVGRVLPDGTTQLWSYEYNAQGHVTKVTDPVGRQLSYGYDMNGIDLLTVSNTTPPTNDLLVRVTKYNGMHEPLSVTATNGQVTNYDYNSYGQRTTSTDPLNRKWTNVYDGSGYFLRIDGPTPGSPPEIATTQYTFKYDDQAANGTLINRVTRVFDAIGRLQRFSYDNADRLTDEVFPDGTDVRLDYSFPDGTPSLDVTRVTDRRSNTTYFTYYPDRNLHTITDPLANTTTLLYYPNGLLYEVDYPSRQGSAFLHRDLQGRIIRSSTGFDVSMDYDSAGRVKSKGLYSPIVAAGGSSQGTVSTLTYSYNADDTVHTVTYGDGSQQQGGVDSFHYDSRYPRMNLATSANSYDVFAYNPVGSPPSLGANRLNYVSSIISGQPLLGSVSGSPPYTLPKVSYTYDELNRVQTRVVNDGVNGDFSESFGYDELGRLKSASNALDSFTYGYSDATPRVSTVSGNVCPQESLTYYPPPGLNEYVQYHGLLQSATFTDPSGANDLAAFAYQYNENDRVKNMSTTYSGPANPNGLATQVAGYEHDVLNQLVSATVTGGQMGGALSYGYDGDGNITAAGGAPSNTSPFSSQYVYGANGLDQMDGVSYDGQGNATAAGGCVQDVSGNPTTPMNYTWDAANRLATVISPTGESDFSYDPFGRLVRIVENSGGAVVADHSYVWCGSERCLEYDNFSPGAGASKQYFAQGWVEAAGGSPFYYIQDQLGSVRAVMDNYSNLRAQYEYDPWGNRRNIAGDIDSDLGFAGYFHHAPSGLDFAMHRAYDSRFGRWINPDPIGINGGLNLYRYADGDPVSVIDPSGLIGLGVYGGAQGEAGFIGGVAAQFDSGAGVFYTPAGGFSTGAFTGAGVFAGAPLGGDGYPAGGNGSVTGVFGGFGGGFFGTTADSVADLGGPFHVISFNVALGIGWSLQFAWGGGSVVVAVSPPLMGWGLGISASIYDTNTIDTSMLNRCN